MNKRARDYITKQQNLFRGNPFYRKAVLLTIVNRSRDSATKKESNGKRTRKTNY